MKQVYYIEFIYIYTIYLNIKLCIVRSRPVCVPAVRSRAFVSWHNLRKPYISCTTIFMYVCHTLVFNLLSEVVRLLVNIDLHLP